MATDPIHSEASWSRPNKGGAMSEEEYHKLEHLDPEHKYEYIGGIAYMMSGGSIGHDRIARRIASLLEEHLTGSCIAAGSDVQVLIGTKKSGKRHFVYPDATVSCSPADGLSDNLLIESPRVVIEVLSPGTETKDRGVKFRAYQKCPTMQEIVLVNQFAVYIEIWQRDEQNIENWNYRHYSRGETVRLASIGVQIAIEEIYRGLDFLRAEQEDEDDE